MASRSGSNYLKEIVLLFCSIAVCGLAAFGLVLLFGLDKQPEPGGDGSITKSLQIKLKELIKKNIELDERVIGTPELDMAISKIKNRLLEKTRDFPFEIDIIVIDSDVVNAAAFPGGLIVVYAGLIKLAETPEELASVLSHELGHVAESDSMKLIVRQIGIAVVQSIITGGGGSDAITGAISTVINAQYSQAQEKKADEYACVMLTESRIDPIHLARFFERLGEREESRGGGILKYLATHPELPSRIGKLKSCSAEFNGKEERIEIDWEKVKRSLPSVFDE